MLEKRVLKRLKSWNKRALNEKDALEFCAENDVHLIKTELVDSGKYIVYQELNFILLNPFLPESLHLWVFWHEIAHFILHSPLEADYSPEMLRVIEREANIAASVCLIPVSDVKRNPLNELQKKFPAELVAIRKFVFEEFGY